MPIVTTNVGGIPEIFGTQAGELVPAGDADALAGAIKSLVTAPDGGRMAALRRRDLIAEKFSVPVMERAVTATYTDILARKRG
jgi:glycosyltransferase involved in cell wall biosynthesis